MHAKPDLRVFLKWMIYRSGSVITDVIPLEANLKFNLSTLLLLTACIALAVGWAWGRRFYETKLEDQYYTLEDVESCIIGSFNKNLFAQRLDSLSNGEITQEEFDKFRDGALLDSVIYLYLNEHIATNTKFDLSDGVSFSTDQNNRIVYNAGWALRLLGLESTNDVASILNSDTNRIEWHGEDLYSSSNKINDSFTEFIERAIDHNNERRRQIEESAK